VQHASLPQQRHVVTRLDRLADTLRDEGIGSPAILIVGDVLSGLAALPAGTARDLGFSRAA
jgi:uroporphyrin-III C-methyltransferase